MQISASVKQYKSGFTVIEVMLAIFLLAVLATIAFVQFNNFSRDSKNVSVKNSLATLRSGIQKQYGQMRLHCNLTESEVNLHPDVNQLVMNDITAGTASGKASVCSAGEIPRSSDRFFVSWGIPPNDWSDRSCSETERRTIYSAEGVPSDQMLPGTKVVQTVKGSCGWIYSSDSGRIKANSNNNGGYPNGEYESSY